MSTVQRIELGSEITALHQGRSPHGRWRYAYHRAEPPAGQEPSPPAALVLIQDAERLAFALADGPAAELLAGQVADYLWTRETVDDDWPNNLRDWLADVDQWPDAPPGCTAFACGRLERSVIGGQIHLAWLGINGVRLLDRAELPLTLDTVLEPDECWTPKHGPEPVGMALHAYHGSLFDLNRLMVYTASADPLSDDLPDLSNIDLEQAVADWGEEAGRDLVLLDLRLNPVLTEPDEIVLSYHWVSANLCQLSWPSTPAATAYRIEESATPDFEDPTLLAELTDGRQLHYQFTPPTTARRYYRVIPLNQSIPGPPSDPLIVAPMTLSPPVMDEVQWSEDGGYLLCWTPIAQATGYEVQMSAAANFEPRDSTVVYRGDLSETYLPPDTLPRRYYRVRAINALYTPNSPSAWSQPRQSPARLETPRFKQVTQKRLVWHPVPGARQYAIHVTPKNDPESEGEITYTTDTYCLTADQPANYRVRAFRRPDDTRTVSEWSEAVTVSPAELVAERRLPGGRLLISALAAAAAVLIIAGAGLGLAGLEVFETLNASNTPTAIPQAMIDATATARQNSLDNATTVPLNATRITGLLTDNQRLRATRQAQIDAEATRARIPTATPSITPNLTETIEVAFVGAQTATAALWTTTPTPTYTVTPSDTFTPSSTPNLTETIEVAFVGAQTATAAGWTATPTPTYTVTPSDTPDLPATVNAAIDSALSATISAQTPTVDWIATADAGFIAGLPEGCYVVQPPEAVPVYETPSAGAAVIRASVPRGARLVASQERTGSPVTWYKVDFDEEGKTVSGWIVLPDGTGFDGVFGGSACGGG
ncbi:MAG: hypothetical protein JXJ20_02205 [Anaerolineae bacterium]|nr:hypothetical protein [Anaerolineae bacterium]